jgi:NAD(P)-dependent dehydrogenase (short-subunit alcohol dehydrogenase family)
MDHKKLSGKIAEGAAVTINYFSHSGKAEEVVDVIRSGGGTAVALQADVSRIEGIQRLFEKTLEHFGRLDMGSGSPNPLRTSKKKNLIDCLPSMSKGHFLPVSKPLIEFPMVEESSIFLLRSRE